MHSKESAGRVAPLSDYLDSSREDLIAFVERSLGEMIRVHDSDVAVEELEHQLSQRESFFSLVSHDLRGPLTTAKICSELLSCSPEMPENLQALARRITLAVDRANGMIGDFLDARRLESGMAVPVQLASCDLHEVLQPAIEEMNLIHRGRCRYRGQAGTVGIWDRVALRRAVDNLVNNALKYGAADGEVSVSVEDLGGSVSISVHNAGNPIPAVDLDTLFTWNRRTESALQSGQTGWGLGLVLVKGVAEAHGGSVKAESSAESGTTFSIFLPKHAATPRSVH